MNGHMQYSESNWGHTDPYPRRGPCPGRAPSAGQGSGEEVVSSRLKMSLIDPVDIEPVSTSSIAFTG